MIHFLLTRAHAYTLEQYLQTWGRDLRDRIAPPIFFEQLAHAPRLHPGTYIFSDLERLSPVENDLAIEVYRQLSSRPSAFRLLNDPAKVLRRLELLRTLHAAGINRFTARRIDDSNTTLKFPVFLRNESNHDGAISPLLHSAAEIDRAIADATAKGLKADDLLLVEYLDTSDSAGVFSKFSYFRVGPRLVARHLFCKREWMIKHAGLIEIAFVEAEMEFLKANSHAEQLQRVFDIAHVDYGRIDYAVLDGQVQTWEINTNPTIIVAPGRVAPPRLHAQGIFAAQFAEAMTAIDYQPANESPHRMQIPRELARRLNVTLATRALRPVAKALRWLGRRPFVDRLG